MCFSAGASFGASALLGAIGVIAVVKANTTPQRLFASIPLLFAAQQFTEGMLWLSINNPAFDGGQSFFTHTFLVFAMMVWPVWIPLTIRLLEKDVRRKKILNVLLCIGAMVSVLIGVVLLVYPVHVIPTHHHLHYRFDFPVTTRNIIWIFSLLYFMATIITPFISSIKRMKLLGAGFLLSYMFAVIFYNGFVVSVWCYFGAILSAVVLWIILGIRKPFSPSFKDLAAASSPAG